MSEENIATSRRLIEEGFTGGNLDLVDELCTEDFVGHDPVAGDEDREASKRSIAGYRQAFPDLTFTVEDAFAAGDKVVVRWSGTGTFENEFMGQQPTGERGDPVEGITIDRFEDGRIAESWVQWNVMTLMRNIGVLPEAAVST
jgi:steroid delta-isomerase-like uncharacterized protein